MLFKSTSGESILVVSDHLLKHGACQTEYSERYAAVDDTTRHSNKRPHRSLWESEHQVSCATHLEKPTRKRVGAIPMSRDRSEVAFLFFCPLEEVWSRWDV